MRSLKPATLAMLLGLALGSALADDKDTVLIETPTIFRGPDGVSTVSVPAGLYKLAKFGAGRLQLESRTGGPKVMVKAVLRSLSASQAGVGAIHELNEANAAQRLTLPLSNSRGMSTVGVRAGDYASTRTASFEPAQSWRRINAVRVLADNLLPAEPAPLFINRIGGILVTQDRWNHRSLKVSYRFEGGPKCADNRGLIRAELPDLPLTHYATTEIGIVAEPPNVIHAQRTHAQWPTVTVEADYKGLVPEHSDSLRIRLDCAIYAPGATGPLAQGYIADSKWWAFDPPESLDGDLVADAAEAMLANKYAPEVRLVPNESANPSSVDWYLGRVSMRFNHGGGCPDHEVLASGSVTQQNLALQSHRTAWGYVGVCGHNDSRAYSDASAKFFIQPTSEVTHSGSGNPNDWPVYAHVRGCQSGIRGYMAVQYWFFYPYNDAFGKFNHEGDWERITVYLDELGERYDGGAIYFSQHNAGKIYRNSDIDWVDGTHPVVYAARGTHANYPKAGDYDIPVVSSIPVLGLKDEARDGGIAWATWNRVVNVGESGLPLNGQTFMLYGGLWGEIGEFDFTTGPRGPAFHSSFEEDFPGCPSASSGSSHPDDEDIGKSCPAGSRGCGRFPNGKYEQCVGAGQQCP